MEVSQDQLLSFSFGKESWKVTPHFAPIYRQYLHSGIQAAIDNHGELIKRGKRKALYLLRLPFENQTREYFLKVYSHHRLSSRLKAYLKQPRGIYEFYTGLKIVQRNISTIVPCAAGIKKNKGAFMESYFLSEKMSQTENFNLFLLRESRNGDLISTNRRPIMENLGILIRTMHAMGVLQKDLAPNNFLLGIGGENQGQLYLVDYERVKILPFIPEIIQRWALSKLNRIGLEVSLSDRLRFLRSYRPELNEEELKTLSRKIDRKTLVRIKKDIRRLRLSNVYTAAHYLFFQQDGYWGYCRKGYDLDALLIYANQTENQNLANKNHFLWKRVKSEGSELARIVRASNEYPPEKLWATTWGLKLARIPVLVPLAMVTKQEDKRDGFLVMPVRKEARALTDFLQTVSDPDSRGNLQKSFLRILKCLHRIGTFSGQLSGEKFIVEKNKGGGLTIYLHNVEGLRLLRKRDKRLSALDIEAIKDIFS